MRLVLQPLVIKVECVEKSIGASIGTDNHRGFPVEPDEGALIQGLVEQDELEEVLIVKASLVEESVVPDLHLFPLRDTAECFRSYCLPDCHSSNVLSQHEKFTFNYNY